MGWILRRAATIFSSAPQVHFFQYQIFFATCDIIYLKSPSLFFYFAYNPLMSPLKGQKCLFAYFNTNIKIFMFIISHTDC